MPTLSTVNQFTTNNPAFTLGGLRSLIFNEDSNGLKSSGAVVRIGRKVLIDDAKFFAWIESQNGGLFNLADAGVKFDLRAQQDIPAYPKDYLDWCIANGKPDPRLIDSESFLPLPKA